jgi:hypothetical protein
MSEFHVGVWWRQNRAQEFNRHCDHVFMVAAAEYCLLNGRRSRKYVDGRNRSIGYRGDGLVKERVEGTRAKFDSENPAAAFVLPNKTSQLHPVNPRPIGCECQLNTRVRKEFTRFGCVRFDLPALKPKVLDPIA